ncbi:MAG: type II toxin-antitoxin system HicB family antitoxin [Nitrososphaerales archaeon]
MHEKAVRTAKGRRFTAVLEKEDVGGYSVRCVELPQAISQGETREEALSNIKESIELVLDYLEEKAKTHKGKRVEFAEVVV